MPVDRRLLGQPVADREGDPFASLGADRGAKERAVDAPRRCGATIQELSFAGSDIKVEDSRARRVLFGLSKRGIASALSKTTSPTVSSFAWMYKMANAPALPATITETTSRHQKVRRHRRRTYFRPRLTVYLS
jgi:hypothetical protein